MLFLNMSEDGRVAEVTFATGALVFTGFLLAFLVREGAVHIIQLWLSIICFNYIISSFSVRQKSIIIFPIHFLTLSYVIILYIKYSIILAFFYSFE